jgi:hypothetical protein
MPSTKKDFEAARLGVFATPGLPLAHLNLIWIAEFGLNCSYSKAGPVAIVKITAGFGTS